MKYIAWTLGVFAFRWLTVMNPDSVAGPHYNQMVALLISCDSTSRDGLNPTSKLTA